MKDHVRTMGKSLSILLVLCVCVSCATIFGKGFPENLNVRSTPDQASVVIMDEDGKKVYEGKTPLIVSLEKKKGYFQGKTYTVKINKEGFAEQTVTVDTRLTGWYFGNILLGGALGMLIVDPLTGAMWTLDQNEVDVALASSQGSQNEKLQFGVVLLQDVPESVRDKMTVVSR